MTNILEGEFFVTPCTASVILNQSATQTIRREYGMIQCTRTFDTRVAGHQIKLEVLWAGRRAVEQLVWDGDATRPATGAASVGESSHVRVAADVAVVTSYTAAILHPAIVGATDQDHFTLLTRDLQLFPLTVLNQSCKYHRH